MKTNVNVSGRVRIPITTHEGALAARITPEQELRRLVAACMLWEDNFYESGKSVAERIEELVPACRPEFVAACAYEARTVQKLRHAPLLLVAQMARTKNHAQLVGKLLPDVIQRADELAEYVAITAKVNGVAPNAVKSKLSAQAKKGLAKAFGKFSEYDLAKYDRAGPVKLRDVLFLAHPKADTPERDALYKRLIEGKLATPDTWEVQLSAGADKRETFTRLMQEGKLGALAFLRNLRGMREAGVDEGVIRAYAEMLDIKRVLPFRFLAAARAVPQFEPMLEPLMLRACEGRDKLAGKTVVLVDVSGSMSAPVSGKSDINRLDAACGVAILLRELCEDVEVMTFENRVQTVPARRGFALRDAIGSPRGGTMLGAAVATVNARPYDRLVVITDEQTADRVPAPHGKGYVINVGTNRHGVGYGKWVHIDGWSEGVIDYLVALEKLADGPKLLEG